jgi:hypothetical protein
VDGPFVNYTQAFRTLEPNKITNNPNSSPRVSAAYLTLLNGLLTSMYFDNMNLVSSILLLIRGATRAPLHMEVILHHVKALYTVNQLQISRA